MQMEPSLVFDLVLLALLALAAITGYRRGLLAAVVRFVGLLASLLGAWLLSQKAGPYLFENFLRQSFIERVEETIAQQGTVDLADLVGRYAGFLPQSVQDRFIQSAGAALDLSAPDVAQNIVLQVVEPLFVPVITLLVFFVAFAVLRLAVGMLSGLLTTLNHVPLLGGANQVLGFVFGLLTGLLEVYLVLCVVWAVMVITSGQLPLFNEAALSASWGYQVFTRVNPFL
ncbi:MAG: CvpA family protein [Oscillospiraceae bacterium]|nr:CvpA family protein [Oscillospiraceae bacterium]